ncbi:Uncharacterized protein SCF082_LOCUS47243 [Durusdinium trenchii]|uniref:Uncharacterized protein n=1 Tax=Durusdinium trenchii TaxID=1381693 RepID=A0ABP0RL57_9DINO
MTPKFELLLKRLHAMGAPKVLLGCIILLALNSKVQIFTEADEKTKKATPPVATPAPQVKPGAKADTGNFELTRINKRKASMAKVAAITDSEDEDDDESGEDEKAVVVNTMEKEFQRFEKFANSLLNRSAKLTDLAQSLETELQDMSADSSEQKRTQKAVENLDASIAVLDREYEQVETARSSLVADQHMTDNAKKELLG